MKMTMEVELPDDMTDDEVEAFRSAWRDVMAMSSGSATTRDALTTVAIMSGLHYDETSHPLSPRFVREGER